MGLFNIFNRRANNNIITSPVNGYVTNLKKVPDKVFSSGMMGKGLGFISDDNNIYAPCDGKIIMIASTKHAIGLETNGVEILIHVGMDTCMLNGKGIDVHVNLGERVSKGELLISYDGDFMNENKIDMITPLVITNSDECDVELIVQDGIVTKNTEIMKVKKHESNKTN